MARRAAAVLPLLALVVVVVVVAAAVVGADAAAAAASPADARAAAADADATRAHPQQQQADADAATRAHRAALLRSLIAALPKAELHLHIEGTLEVPLMLRLASRNNVSLPYADAAEALAARSNYASLAPFLDAYRVAMATLRTRADFAELAAQYLKRAAENNVRRAEIFVDLQTHVKNGVRQEDVVGGIGDAVAAAALPGHAPRPVDAALILCFVRDWGVGAALKSAAAATPYYARFIGVGLASAEVGNPPAPFWPLFRAAKAAGLHRVAHAGEEAGPDYVWQAIRALGVERVDHGVRSLEDPALVSYLKKRRVPLTVCPLSNRALKVYDGQLEARMRELFLESGMTLTVNSDDPAYFKREEEGEDGYVNAAYSYLASLVGLGPSDLLRLAQASFNASFWDADSKAAGVREAEAAWRDWNDGPDGREYRRLVVEQEQQQQQRREQQREQQQQREQGAPVSVAAS